MQETYIVIGMIVFWIIAIIALISLPLVIMYFAFDPIINFLGAKFRVMYLIMEFGYYRKEFKKWKEENKKTTPPFVQTLFNRNYKNK